MGPVNFRALLQWLLSLKWFLPCAVGSFNSTATSWIDKQPIDQQPTQGGPSYIASSPLQTHGVAEVPLQNPVPFADPLEITPLAPLPGHSDLIQIESRHTPCCPWEAQELKALEHSGNDADISLSTKLSGGCLASSEESYESEKIASITGGHIGTRRAVRRKSFILGVLSLIVGTIMISVGESEWCLYPCALDFATIPFFLGAIVGILRGVCSQQQTSITLYTDQIKPAGGRIRTLDLPLYNKVSSGVPAAEKFQEGKNFVAAILARARANREIQRSTTTTSFAHHEL